MNKNRLCLLPLIILAGCSRTNSEKSIANNKKELNQCYSEYVNDASDGIIDTQSAYDHIIVIKGDISVISTGVVDLSEIVLINMKTEKKYISEDGIWYQTNKSIALDVTLARYTITSVSFTESDYTYLKYNGYYIYKRG